MKLNLLVFYGSVRSARQGIKAARFVTAKCRDRGHETALIDPLDYPLPLLDRMDRARSNCSARELVDPTGTSHGSAG